MESLFPLCTRLPTRSVDHNVGRHLSSDVATKVRTTVDHIGGHFEVEKDKSIIKLGAGSLATPWVQGLLVVEGLCSGRIWGFWRSFLCPTGGG